MHTKGIIKQCSGASAALTFILA